jgi:hypothetical protein
LAFSGYKAREDERARGGRNHRTGGGLKTKEEEQTCIPLFLLKETEEAKEKATNKRK